MKHQSRYYIIACLMCLSVASFGMGQEVAPPRTSKPVVPIEQTAPRMTGEEKVVRAAYEKLTGFSKAALFINRGALAESPSDDEFLRFELSNFRIGPIQEIMSALHSEIQTGASGGIIEVNRSVTQLNKEEERVAYRAQWTTGQYASVYDPHWTVGDLLGAEPNVYFDVGAYALYDVMVSFQGKTRTYRALALFHNPYGSVTNLKPSFWDSVVGSGGVLSEVLAEKRPPVEPKFSPSNKKGTTSGAPEGYSLETNAVRVLAANGVPPLELQGLTQVQEPVASTSESYAETTSAGTIVQSTTEDTREHTVGKHGQMVQFRGVCSEESTNDQTCKVEFNFIYTYETGKTSTFFYVHKNRTDEKIETASGPRGIPISCSTGRGVATRNCLNPNCLFAVALTGSGVNMQMTGGDVWNGQLVHRQTCNLPASSGGGCTTAGFNGSCPPGTYPDGFGRCCSSGGGGICNAFFAPIETAASDDPSLMLPVSGCCNDLERYTCEYGGGSWDEPNCNCLSPIVIDVAGNGFNLTDAGAGVMFDITSDGVPDQISWTSANSDDAWLAYDRNGNGTIDNGKELFGSSTPQPYLSQGESKNGFRALAMLDRPEYGGNNDGQINSRDSLFSNLKLWQDRNHNGFSETEELQSLADSDIRVIELQYRESRRHDENGNWFRYRAKVKDARGAQVGRWAWDVFLKRTN